MRAVRGVRGACFSPIAPVPVSAPRVVAWSPEVARSLDLSEAACASDTFLQVGQSNQGEFLLTHLAIAERLGAHEGWCL